MPQLVDLGNKVVDLGQAFVQQGFKSADSTLLVFQFSAQAADGRLQAVDLSLLQGFVQAGAAAGPGHGPEASTWAWLCQPIQREWDQEQEGVVGA